VQGIAKYQYSIKLRQKLGGYFSVPPLYVQIVATAKYSVTSWNGFLLGFKNEVTVSMERKN